MFLNWVYRIITDSSQSVIISSLPVAASTSTPAITPTPTPSYYGNSVPPGSWSGFLNASWLNVSCGAPCDGEPDTSYPGDARIA